MKMFLFNKNQISNEYFKQKQTELIMKYIDSVPRP